MFIERQKNMALRLRLTASMYVKVAGRTQAAIIPGMCTRVILKILIPSKKLAYNCPQLAHSKQKFFWKILKNELSGAKIKFFKIFIRFGWNSYSEYIGQYYIQYKNLSQFGQVKKKFNF